MGGSGDPAQPDIMAVPGPHGPDVMFCDGKELHATSLQLKPSSTALY